MILHRMTKKAEFDVIDQTKKMPAEAVGAGAGSILGALAGGAAGEDTQSAVLGGLGGASLGLLGARAWKHAYPKKEQKSMVFPSEVAGIPTAAIAAPAIGVAGAAALDQLTHKSPMPHGTDMGALRRTFGGRRGMLRGGAAGLAAYGLTNEDTRMGAGGALLGLMSSVASNKMRGPSNPAGGLKRMAVGLAGGTILDFITQASREKKKKLEHAR